MGSNELSKIVEEVLREFEHGAKLPVDRIRRSSPGEMAKFIDHTLLKPEASWEEIRQLCEEAKVHSFVTVCINPFWVSECCRILERSDSKVCTVTGFPLGACTTGTKVKEAGQSVENGAREVDMVMNIGALKSGRYELVENDIRSVVGAIEGITVKVILETCLLTDEEKIIACILSQRAGAKFVKTSTGFNKAGATSRDVALMRNVVGDSLGVKASGGIRTYEDACKMIQSGANRIGTSSGVSIVTGSIKSAS